MISNPKCINGHDLCYQGPNDNCPYCEKEYEITFVGDIHGNFNAYKQIIDGHDNVIQLGDYGMGFVPNEVTDINKRFIRGNHDDPRACEKEPNYIHDGTIEHYNGETMMFIGGADSVDKHRRVEGVSWWRDEECSYPQLLHFYDDYMRHKPTIMVTHDCPEEVSKVLCRTNNMTKFPGSSRTRNALQNMWENHKPRCWLFGHWHTSFDMTILGTRFICLNVNKKVTINI